MLNFEIYNFRHPSAVLVENPLFNLFNIFRSKLSFLHAILLLFAEILELTHCITITCLYNDDIEVGNGLSSKAGINKITMYYFQKLNSSDLSRLTNIHLAVVVYASDVKQFGHNHVPRLFLNELKKLELGVKIGTSIMYGTVTHLPADNLVANESQLVFPPTIFADSAKCITLTPKQPRNRFETC